MITQAVKRFFSSGTKVSRENLVKQQKKKIREQILRRLEKISPQQREEKSFRITEKLLSSGEFADASTVMVYVSLPQEVDTREIIQEALKQGKRVGVPYMIPGGNKMVASEITMNYRLEKGPLGVSQPAGSEVKAIPLDEIDLVVVPALAYDKANRRLGRGKAFYDSFLAGAKPGSIRTIGIAFDEQVVENLPQSSHDIPVDRVITDRN